MVLKGDRPQQGGAVLMKLVGCHSVCCVCHIVVSRLGRASEVAERTTSPVQRPDGVRVPGQVSRAAPHLCQPQLKPGQLLSML